MAIPSWVKQTACFFLVVTSLTLGTEALHAQPAVETAVTDAEGGPTVRGSTVGYIDSAVPLTQFRLRWDAAFNIDRPTRAEFIYAKAQPPGGPGLPHPETRINYQDLSGYLEIAGSTRWSAFVETPIRFLNPEINANATGLADMNAGFKLVLLDTPQWLLTGQLRTYIPTGDASLGLGTRHVSLEPALLFNYQPRDWLLVEGECRYWQPIGGTDFAGDILRYGVGLALGRRPPDSFWATPVTEFVGWTVLSGKESAGTAILSARGDTIVNVKVGLRFGFGEMTDFYVGYGRALTSTDWYKDIVRVEFRMRF